MGRRISIDLTDAADQEVKRLCEKTGMSTADLFRIAMSVFRTAIGAKERPGDVICVMNTRTNEQFAIDPFGNKDENHGPR